jgi:ribonuclease E
VTLRSGGYLVINQTEALVAIDVNSGKATREFSIEETAHHTNLEAADEIARPLKQRDLAGLIVIDFIDMEEKRNNRAVERRMKEALRFDRARIQVGRISHFGLLEMSRQRLRTGVLEGSTSQCAHCQGTGIIRSTESVALAVLRGLEDTIMAGARASLIATTTPSVALYILNNKRPFINDMEARLGLPIMVTGSDKLAGANFTIEKGAAPAQPQRRIERNVVNMESGFEGEGDDEGGEFEAREQPAQGRESSGRGERSERSDRGGRGERDQSRASGEEEGGSRRRRRRRRGGRGRDREEGSGRFADEPRGNVEEIAEFDAEGGDGHDGHEHHGHEHNGHDHGEEAQAREPRGEEEGGERSRERNGRSRRRGRRGGRRGRDRAERGGEAQAQNGGSDQPEYHAESEDGGDDMNAGRHEAIADFPNLPADGNEDLPAKEVRRDRPAPPAAAEEAYREPAPQPEAAPPPAPRRRSGSSEPKLERIVGGEQVAEETSSSPTRKGWWQRK